MNTRRMAVALGLLATFNLGCFVPDDAADAGLEGSLRLRYEVDPDQPYTPGRLGVMEVPELVTAEGTFVLTVDADTEFPNIDVVVWSALADMGPEHLFRVQGDVSDGHIAVTRFESIGPRDP